jgi:hypothetical protein
VYKRETHMESGQTLFDIVERTELRPKKRHESLFEYCNVSARRPVVYIRELLKTWFRRFPETVQRDLRSRFRSPIDAHHLGAFFELYLHELLTAMGLEVQVHPHLSGGKPTHPDFLVLKRGQRLFYLEATLAGSSRDEAAENARISQVYDTLDCMPSPNFFLFIQYNGTPATPPPGSRLRQELGQWLSSLDPDEMAQRLKAEGLTGLPPYQRQRVSLDSPLISGRMMDGTYLSFRCLNPQSTEGVQGCGLLGELCQQ